MIPLFCPRIYPTIIEFPVVGYDLARQVQRPVVFWHKTFLPIGGDIRIKMCLDSLSEITGSLGALGEQQAIDAAAQTLIG